MLKAFIFDMGGTLEDVVHRPEFNLPCGKLLLEYLERHGIRFDSSPGDFMNRLEKQHKAYRIWAVEQNRELSPFDLWSQWFLKGMKYNQDRLQVIADNLAGLWELNYYRRSLRPEAPAMLRELEDMGFSLGIISNTSSHTQVIGSLHQYGIDHYFSSVYISVTSGFRKPHPELFLAAARDLGALPEECVYVGDTISRDVRGARLAGYAATLRIESLLSAGSDAGINNPGTRFPGNVSGRGRLFLKGGGGLMPFFTALRFPRRRTGSWALNPLARIKQEGEEADYLITGLNEIPGIAGKLREKYNRPSRPEGRKRSHRK
ncbi:MAG: HAD-IA family hydrolase [Treponema sp.]|jgi:putative hydrolase of the HAD superfamily|nr:HAD-IA family hydrolase [Treponema sp.]